MNRSNTAKKLPPKKNFGIPFKSGYDPRRNLKGRPKVFDELRALFQEIAHDEIEIDGKKMTRAEAIGIMMTTHPDKFKDFLEYAYGKVPQALELSGKDGKVIEVTIKKNDSD